MSHVKTLTRSLQVWTDTEVLGNVRSGRRTGETPVPLDWRLEQNTVKRADGCGIGVVGGTRRNLYGSRRWESRKGRRQGRQTYGRETQVFTVSPESSL